MEFISAHDLRNQSDQRWARLIKADEVIVTVNGQPIALLAGITGETLEPTLKALRRARAQLAVSRLRAAAQAGGASHMTPAEVEAEIKATRRARQKQAR